jgi:hypothetical protein
MGVEQWLDGAVAMSRAVKYYSRTRHPDLRGTPETTHALYHASHMMWGEYGYNAINLQTYG